MCQSNNVKYTDSDLEAIKNKEKLPPVQDDEDTDDDLIVEELGNF